MIKDSFDSKKYSVDMFLSSTEILLDNLSKELNKIRNDIRVECPNCDNEARFNSRDEMFCIGCALLVRACNCK